MQLQNAITISGIVLGISSCIVGLFGIVALSKLRSFSEFDALKYSSVAMLLNLLTADIIKEIFYVSGMIRYIMNITSSNDLNNCSPDLFCEVQSFLGIWFNSVTLICMLMIGLFAIYQVTETSDERETYTRKVSHKFLILCCILCWIIPFFTTLIPAIEKKLGEDNTLATSGWCWIKICNKTLSKNDIVYMMLYSRGFEMLVFLLNVSLYLFLMFVIRKKEQVNIDGSPCGLSMSGTSEFLTPVNWNVRNDSRLLFLINISILLIRVWGITRAVMISAYMTHLNSSFTNTLETANNILFYFQTIMDSLEVFSVVMVLLICSRSSRIILCKIIQCRQFYAPRNFM